MIFRNHFGDFSRSDLYSCNNKKKRSFFLTLTPLKGSVKKIKVDSILEENLLHFHIHHRDTVNLLRMKNNPAC